MTLWISCHRGVTTINDYDNRKRLCAAGYEDAIVFENPDYDNAIIGITTDGQVVYDYYMMVEHLIHTDGMSEEEAVEFIDYNTLGTIHGRHAYPIVMYHIDYM